MPDKATIRFEWDEFNEGKLLERHGVTAWEAESCFFREPDIRKKGEVFLLMGPTDEGRILLVVFERKPHGVIRIYSARDLDEDEKRIYRRRKRG